MKIPNIMFLLRFNLILLIFSGLNACSVINNIFGDDEGEEPAELVNFDSEVTIRRLWSTDIGDGQGDKYNRLKPAIEGDVIYVVANNGLLRALDL